MVRKIYISLIDWASTHWPTWKLHQTRHDIIGCKLMGLVEPHYDLNMLPNFAAIVLFWSCQQDYLVQNNFLIKKHYKRNSGKQKNFQLKVLTTCHLYFLKCLLLKKQIWLLFMLAKTNALLACLQMLAKTIQYPYNHWLQVGKSLTLTVRESTKNQTGHLP